MTKRTINPASVRYIKLGRGGMWEQQCIRDGIIRLGFGTGDERRFSYCVNGSWNELRESFLQDDKNDGTATRFTNEIKEFCGDPGNILWLTFYGDKLWWAFTKKDPFEKYSDGNGIFRRTKDPWQSTDIAGSLLSKDKLSGALTRLAAYRGTSCKVIEKRYIIDRINGKKRREVDRGLAAVHEIKQAVTGMVTLLQPKDFELLVDLVFSASGWRRKGPVGGPQKTFDILLELPSTNERAFVQIKSRTTSKDLPEYVNEIEPSDIDKMFFVYHTGKASTTDGRVFVIGPDRLAEMILDAGLTNWLIEKVS